MAGFDSASVQTLYDTAKDEYNNERERSSTIDTKASIALPVLSAFFLAVANECDYSALLQLPIGTLPELLSALFLFLVYTSALACSTTATVYAVRAIYPRSYMTLSSEYFYDEALLKEPAETIRIGITAKLIEATQNNKEQNDKRMSLYSKGWIWGSVSAAAFVLYNVIYNIVTKGI